MNEVLTWLPAELSTLPRYVVALAIGLLMGLERERNPAAKAGLRTFALTALLGVLTTHLATTLGEQWLIAVGLLLVGAMMIAAYLRDPQPAGDPGTTTVAALMLCYSLGVLVWHNEIQLAVMLGIAATMLLYFKPELRGWSEHMTRRDLLSVLQFSVLSLIILPLVPNRNYGPYGALNPYQIWWMVVLIVGVGLAGYAALRPRPRQPRDDPSRGDRHRAGQSDGAGSTGCVDDRTGPGGVAATAAGLDRRTVRRRPRRGVWRIPAAAAR